MKQQFNIRSGWVAALVIIAAVYALLVAVGVVGKGFNLTFGGREGLAGIFEFATNPFIGLLIGILVTTILQSSSTVTSIIVGLVAGGMPIAIAIPMIMGANVGTTVTNTIVSFGHVRQPEEFKRAFAAATVHDFFNLLSIAIFLPLELAFGFLNKLSESVGHVVENFETAMDSPGTSILKVVVKSGTKFMESLVSPLPELWAGIALIILGIVMILFSIKFLGDALKIAFIGKARKILQVAIAKGPITGIFSGTVVTVLVQSSSTTTSIIVPLAGSGVLQLRHAYPFTLGANIGTTITAFLAAMAITGPTHAAAHQIAIVHLLYNVIGVVVIYSIPFLRNIPPAGAEWIANLGSQRKSLAFAYTLGTFFGVPALFVGAHALIT